MCLNRGVADVIDVSSTELRTAARQARQAGDTVGLARQASAAALPGNAFGLMCSPLFLPIYTVVQTAADLMLGSASEAIERAADNLDATAAAFDSTDSTVQSAITELGGAW